jgi:hypothetical protein
LTFQKLTQYRYAILYRYQLNICHKLLHFPKLETFFFCILNPFKIKNKVFPLFESKLTVLKYLLLVQFHLMVGFSTLKEILLVFSIHFFMFFFFSVFINFVCDTSIESLFKWYAFFYNLYQIFHLINFNYRNLVQMANTILSIRSVLSSSFLTKPTDAF